LFYYDNKANKQLICLQIVCSSVLDENAKQGRVCNIFIKIIKRCKSLYSNIELSLLSGNEKRIDDSQSLKIVT